ncbi:MAG: oxidoreductase, partial [Phycisphaerae bacterium]
MATVPEAKHSTAALIDKHHEAMADDPHRDHLGASMLGHKCERYLWLSFRWSFREQIPGRIRRLFRRGHNEEASIISDLRAIGCVVHDRMADGRQYRGELAPHVAGSLDAIIDCGVPEAPKARHVAEFKTHSRKSFDDLAANGVAKSKPLHHVQMQAYMNGMGIDRALYVAVC